MPELPEVEMAARLLVASLAGRIVLKARGKACNVFRGGSRRRLLESLKGARDIEVSRHGKMLMWHLPQNVGIFNHLGMSGKWVHVREAEQRPTHTRLRLDLNDGSELHFNDPRMFGQVMAATHHELAERRAALGPDPLADRLGDLAQRLDTSRTIKVVLMDQSVVAGLGNIQVTEALFRAGIHPTLPADSLNASQVGELADAIMGCLSETLETLDTQGLMYLSEAGTSNPFQVYGRAGEPCPRCTRTLAKITLAQRTSVYCSACQPLDGERPGRKRPRRTGGQK